VQHLAQTGPQLPCDTRSRSPFESPQAFAIERFCSERRTGLALHIGSGAQRGSFANRIAPAGKTVGRLPIRHSRIVEVPTPLQRISDEELRCCRNAPVAGCRVRATRTAEQFERAIISLPLDEQHGATLLGARLAGSVTRRSIQGFRSREQPLGLGIEVELD